MAETQRQILAMMKGPAGVTYAPFIVPGTPGTPIIVPVEVKSFTKETIEKMMQMPLPVMAAPFGRVRKKGSLAATTTTYETVTEITVANEKEFELSNFSISADQDLVCKLLWQDKALTPIYYVMAKLPFDKWFPPKYYLEDGKPIMGDGKSKIQLQAAYLSGGTGSTICEGEIVGDEV
jgi:hypothetical protein